MRVFLAVPCGKRLTTALTTSLDEWRSLTGGLKSVRWTRPETWHLTLQFLGEWPENRLAGLKTALAAMRPEPVFTLCPGDLGGFPNLRSPRVLFLHLADDGQSASLAGRVRTVVAETWPEGPQDNRPFRGHVTLGRIRHRLPRSELNCLQKLKLHNLPQVPVEGFDLVASELRPTGPRYTTLARFKLRK
jgi:2'-5' RNA ligase